MVRTWTVFPLLIFMLSGGCMPALNVATVPDPSLFPEPGRNAITFWGHATTYVDVGGVGIITDPVFAGAYSPFHKRTIPVPPAEAFDQTEIILISHAHFDHLHPETIDQFSGGAVLLCPELSANHLDGESREVRVMRPGDEYAFRGGVITAVPAHHPGGRLSLKARHDGNALGYVIETGDQTIYYSGDTEYFEGLRKIGAQYDLDVAILNVNAHLNGYDAVLAIAALGVPTVIPTHYGAYSGSNARNSPHWRSELKRLVGQSIVPVAVGESFTLDESSVAISRAEAPEPFAVVP